MTCSSPERLIPISEMAGIIVEEREELMVPTTTDAEPTQRTAHLLRPSISSTEECPLFRPPPLSSPLADFGPGELPLKLAFTAWVDPRRVWKTWVDQMQASHQFSWRKAGIYEAIISSTYRIRRSNDLFYGLAERWCPSTNTFVFPWGEATITLEDIMVLGGFSVTGEPACKPVETPELMKIQEELTEWGTIVPRQSDWMKKFMGAGSELEHVAFLSLWLSKFVFGQMLPNSIGVNLFVVAIHLANGTRLALGRAVLACIYRDMSLVKGEIVASADLFINGSGDEFYALTLRAPLRLVQIWAWERFPGLRPAPRAIKSGEPRMARWNGLTGLEVEDVRMALDSSQDTFLWRPYAIATRNWPFPQFYPEREKWVVVDPHLDQELQSFAQCLKVCELLGVDCVDVEMYNPHRVAMQFGIDQDLPWTVTKSHQGHQAAWIDYSKLILNAKFYVPSRFFEADVTTRYLAWWNQSAGDPLSPFTDILRRPTSSRSPRKLRCISAIVEREVAAAAAAADDDDGDLDFPPGFPPKKRMALPGPEGKEGSNAPDVPPGFEQKYRISKIVKKEDLARESEGAAGTDDNGGHHHRSCSSDVYSTTKMNDNGGEQRSYRAVENPGLDMEARMSRVEKAIAELKQKHWLHFFPPTNR